MQLRSYILRDDEILQAAADVHKAHILEGQIGDHVRKLQEVLILLDNVVISDDERLRKYFGTSTAKAVLKFKTQRSIINRSYQNTPDPIVGILTMKAIDDELFRLQDSVSYSDGAPRPCYKDGQLRNLIAVSRLKKTSIT